MNLNLDFTFFTWNVVSNFVLKGLIFSVQLTLIAMIGGIAIGTILALMRLSGKKWLVMPAAAYVNTLRSIPLVMVILWFFLLIPGSPAGWAPSTDPRSRPSSPSRCSRRRTTPRSCGPVSSRSRRGRSTPAMRWA
jgi:His/Glu/Gln/Arg/opine family amino acid ABC transporter permease subunit